MSEPQDFHILNLGAGVQSTTLYLMIANGELPIKLDAAIFADTGEEPIAVYKHLAWLQSLALQQFSKVPPILVRGLGRRLGDDLMRGQNSTGQRFAAIPAFTLLLGADDVGQTRRQCSKEYKIDVIERTIRREICGLEPGRRIPKKKMRVTQYVGISLDESGRFTRLQKRRTLGTMRAPLIERHMTRRDCLDWLRERGGVPHPVPRSACTFCPFHDDAEWAAIKSSPEDWARAVEIDEALRIRGTIAARGMDAPMFLHRSCQPLVQIDFAPKAENRQQSIGFWRSDGFSRECLGVCGL